MPHKLQKFLLVLSLPFVFMFTFASPSSPAATDKPATGKLVTVSGKVTVFDQAGEQSRIAKKGMKVTEGERIVTSEGASAALEFFDGSQLTLQSGTDISLVRLQKSKTKGNVLKFNLALGRLLAEVTKKLSVNSRFEIEAGGVVCGVRGTKFTLKYDPDRQKLSLRVSEGRVYANAGGKHLVFKAGEQTEFIEGHPAAENSADPTAKTKPGFDDPALKDLHERFGAANQAYRNKAVNDPAAGGLKTIPNPNAGVGGGVIEAKP
jgi:hypothetical protein